MYEWWLKFSGFISSVDRISRTEYPETKTRKLPPPKLPPIQKHAKKDGSSLEKATQRQELGYTARRTPPLKSIYIKWKNYKKRSVFQSSEQIKRFFTQFGPVERVVYCSEDCAILVFKLIRSAYIASVYASTQFSRYHVHVMWLPEYLEATIKNTFACRGD